MKKEISYKDLLINILEGEEVPLVVYYKSNKYFYHKDVCEYMNKQLEYLSDVITKDLFVKGYKNIKIGYYESILDQQEREYLRAVIKPFRNRVKYIKKFYNPFIKKELIKIDIDEQPIYLPYFKKGSMYKNMEINKEYTFKDLDL